MASFTSRKNKHGILVHYVQIRIRRNGKIVHSESRSDTDRLFLKTWAASREAQLAQPGAIERLRASTITIEKVLEHYLDDFHGKERFGRSKLAHLEYLKRHPYLSVLSAIDLAPWQLIEHAKSRLAEGAQPQTVNNDFIWLRNAFRDVGLMRNLQLNTQAVDDAAAVLRRQKMISKSRSRNRRPTLEELDKILDWASGRDGRAQLPMVDIILFALFSSRRQEEICRLRWSDLDERRQGVLVRDMKHPRHKQDTFVLIPDRAWEVLQRQPKDSELIFPYKPKSVSGAFTRICSMVGVEDLRFHDLRHECISCLFELGGDIPRVAQVSGHKSWATLQRYTHLTEGGVHDKHGNAKYLINMLAKGG